MSEPQQCRVGDEPTFADLARTSRLTAIVYVLADMGYLFGLIGGIIAPLVMLIQWPLDYLHSGEGHEQLRHWTHYVVGTVVAFCVFSGMFAVSTFVRRRIYFRFMREHSRE